MSGRAIPACERSRRRGQYPGLCRACRALCLIWLVPVAWLVVISFSKGVAGVPNYFWPKYGLTLQNYVKLFTDAGISSGFYFPRWFLNTLLVAVCSCALTAQF